MIAMKDPDHENTWDGFEDFLEKIGIRWQYIPGDPHWFIYIVKCEEEDLTLLKLSFPLVHIQHEMYS
jgi:hypothetical protein